MTIYRWIARSDEQPHWESCLQLGKRKPTPERRGKIKAAAPISGRPSVVDQRERFGDWEGDTVLGKRGRGGLVTLVDRKSGFTLVRLVKRVRSRNVTRAVHGATGTLPEGLRHTLTLDNGKEFSGYEAITRQAGLDVYFARPYHSWERGCNENFEAPPRPWAGNARTLSRDQF